MGVDCEATGRGGYGVVGSKINDCIIRVGGYG